MKSTLGSNRAVRLHIFGASGSGTSTLGRALAPVFGLPCFDADDYYWLPTDPPFTTKRNIPDRITLLERDLPRESWILSGSLCGWGDVLVPRFTHVVFLRLDNEVRLRRLRHRERERYGARIDEGGDMRTIHEDFMAWCNRYETGGMDVRSLALHRHWLEQLSCPVLELRSEQPVETLVREIGIRLGTGVPFTP